MSAGSALRGFFGLVWRILEGMRKVLHLALMLIIFGFVLAALHTSIPIVPRSAALRDLAAGRAGRAAVRRIPCGAHSSKPLAGRIRRPCFGT